MSEQLSKDQLRCLRMLRRGPIYKGAISLMMGSLLSANPQAVLRDLRGRKLVTLTNSAWTITAAGETALLEQATDE